MNTALQEPPSCQSQTDNRVTVGILLAWMTWFGLVRILDKRQARPAVARRRAAVSRPPSP